MIQSASPGRQRSFRRQRRPTPQSIAQRFYHLFVTTCLLLLVSSFVAFQYYYFRDRRDLDLQTNGYHLRGVDAAPPSQPWITDASLAFNDHHAAAQATHLIMVACHGVTISGHLQDADRDEADWFLLPYQKHRGIPQAIVAHISAGLDLARQDPQSLVLFSGGETRPTAGPQSEGASYFRVADAMDLWPKHSNVRARTLSEDFARDSFENFMFSICRFREVTGSYPEKITIVSFTFKKRRFESLHAKALQWPLDRLEYVGVDPQPGSGFELAEAAQGEMENAAKPFEGDPYGCHTKVLKQKRLDRDPFARTPPYELSCPDMKELLHFCGPDIISPGKVPWGLSSSWKS